MHKSFLALIVCTIYVDDRVIKFISAVFSSPILYFYYTDEIPNYGTQCWITFNEQWQWQIYMTLVNGMLSFVLVKPLSVIIQPKYFKI